MKRKQRSLIDLVRDDRNIVAAGLLHDLAILQSSEQRSFGYKRAAKAFAAGGDRAIVQLCGEGTLRRVLIVGGVSGRGASELVIAGEYAAVREGVAGSTNR